MTGPVPDGDGADRLARLHRPFRPRSARLVSTAVAVAFVTGALGLAAVLPTITPQASWADRAGIALFGLAVGWFLMRQAGVRADPDADGLTVRNLVVTRRVAWAEVVSVRFGHGRPWVQLDLADGDTLAVMGIQRADGARAIADARRLATLVAMHSTTPTDD